MNSLTPKVKRGNLRQIKPLLESSLLTLGLSTLTFGRSRTNVLLGAVHVLLFLAYLMLNFER